MPERANPLSDADVETMAQALDSGALYADDIAVISWFATYGPELLRRARELRAHVASLETALRSALIGLEVISRAIAAHIEHTREPIGVPLERAALQVEAVIARLLGAVGTPDG